jgi:AcrR family transcriptional regulator
MFPKRRARVNGSPDAGESGLDFCDRLINNRPMSAAVQRQSAEERRNQVLEAGLREFAERGYHAASTAAIAARAGISQPYIYALFPNKRELFHGVQDLVVARIRAAFLEAARGAASPDEALERMGQAYHELVADRYLLLCQLQGYAAAGDPEIGSAVAARFAALWEDVRRASGASPEAVTQFFACGMLINVTSALDLPDLIAPALQLASG